jgi:hypothetical protein
VNVELPEEEKEKEHNLVRGIPKILANSRYAIETDGLKQV